MSPPTELSLEALALAALTGRAGPWTRNRRGAPEGTFDETFDETSLLVAAPSMRSRNAANPRSGRQHVLGARRATSRTMSQNIDTIKNAYAAFARGDIESMLSTLAPEFEWIEPAGSEYAGTFRTRQELLEKYFMRLGAEYDIKLVPEDFIEVGGTVIVRGRHEGLVRRTGKHVTSRYASFHEFVGGKLVRFEHFFDTELYERARA
jgi:ketosteroid isomerase-like protein